MIHGNVNKVNVTLEAIMDMELRNSRLSLPREGLIALRDARGARIACRRGSFWVTQEGRLRDHVLEAGEALTLDGRGLTVITALRAGEIDIEARTAPAADCNSLGTRWQRWLCRVRQRWVSVPAAA